MALKELKYLEEIRPFYDEDLIKVITGIRRCDKSNLLKQIIEEINENIDNNHIIYINFEDVEYSDIEDFKVLNSFIKNKILDEKNIIYFLKKFKKLIIGKK